MNFTVAFAAALAIHAAVAGALALSAARGTSREPASRGVTIEIEQDATEPVRPVEPTSEEEHVGAKQARGGPSRSAVARTVVASSTTPADVVPQPTTTPPPEPVRFKMTASASTTSAPTTANVVRPSGDVVAANDVTERASKIGGAAPAYPEEARARGVELAAPLTFEIVVDETGRVASARALRHAGYGFDDAAMSALRAYRFAPAKRDGRPVAVRMTWTVDFHFE